MGGKKKRRARILVGNGGIGVAIGGGEMNSPTGGEERGDGKLGIPRPPEKKGRINSSRVSQ